MTFDILIKDGTILDGSGHPPFRGDIGIVGRSIAALGNPELAGAQAAKTIPAAGKFVAPGFVDITNHADVSGSLFANPEQSHLLTQGVTSVLVGNCGTSLAPLVSAEAARTLRAESQREVPNINWRTVAEYLAELSRRPLGVNVGTLMGHGTIRRGLLRGESRALSSEEVVQCSSLIREGMAEGAFGLSLGLVYGHEAHATGEELSAFAWILAANGGMLKVHLRNEGRNLVPAMNEIVQIGRQAPISIIVSHLKAIGRTAWPSFRRALSMMERTGDGTPMHFDLSPYRRTGSFLYLLLPAWAREGGFERMFERIRNPDTRRIIIEELKRATLHFERYIIASALTPGLNGRTLADAAERAGTLPEETILDLLLASGGRVTIFGNTLSFKNILAGVAHPLGAIASDGSGVSVEASRSGRLVHPRATGCFPHFLHAFVKERSVISWEEGIRKMTSLPAELVGFKRRGRIAPKFAADIVVFDPDTIRDRSTYHNPYVHSTGVEAVIVNGTLAVENGQLTGMAAGQVLKKS